LAGAATWQAPRSQAPAVTAPLWTPRSADHTALEGMQALAAMEATRQCAVDEGLALAAQLAESEAARRATQEDAAHLRQDAVHLRVATAMTLAFSPLLVRLAPCETAVFGAGSAGRALAMLLVRHGFTVRAFVDNNQALRGQSIGTVPVISLADAVRARY